MFFLHPANGKDKNLFREWTKKKKKSLEKRNNCGWKMLIGLNELYIILF